MRFSSVILMLLLFILPLGAKDLSLIGTVVDQDGNTLSGVDLTISILGADRDPCGGGGGCGGGHGDDGGDGDGEDPGDGDDDDDGDGEGPGDGDDDDDDRGGGCEGGGCEGGDCEGGGCEGGGCEGGGCEGGGCEGGDCEGGGCEGGGCEGGGCEGGGDCDDGDKKTSAEDGSFEFIITQPGRYVINASIDDFEDTDHIVNVRDDEDIEVEIVMDSPLDVATDFQGLPVESCVVEAYPNPFNSSCAITVSVREAGLVKAEIFDLNGRLVQSISDSKLSAGSHFFTIKGNTLASGVYLLKVQTPGANLLKKICMVR